MTYTVLLDTSSLMYRAFYALPQSIVGADGQPVNALHGYLDMTATVLRDTKPGELIHVYDADWRPQSRVAAYAGYKADRPEDPETLPPQFDWLRDLLNALGMAQAEAPGWEADDAIGALCAAGAQDDRYDIVTGDRDLLQLVRDGGNGPVVRVLYTVRGVSNLRVFDATAVEAEYGVPPDRYVDFAILRGDASDGLPGVPGVGEKTAARLTREYASLDDLMGSVDELTPKLAENMARADGYLQAMRLVVPIRQDVEVKIHRPGLDRTALDELAAQYKLGGPVGRLLAAADRAS